MSSFLNDVLNKEVKIKHNIKKDGTNYEISLIDEIRAEILNKFKDKIPDIRSSSFKDEAIGYIKLELSKRNKETNESLVNSIYNDIFSYSFINKYLEDPAFEEMNGNSFDDIEVIYGDERKTVRIKDKFNSPEHARNIIKKMVLIGGDTIDDANPIRDSHIGVGLRLTACLSPIVDDNIGVIFSLRKLEGRSFTTDELIKMDSYSQEEIEFLESALENGISVLFGGATSSGKTSDMDTIIKKIAKKNQKRIFSIEEDTRELNFLENKESSIKPRVIHTKTRTAKSKENALNVDSNSLVKMSLRFHPDIIVPAELRGEEALACIEASLTGHTISSSAHVTSVTAAYDRILKLAQKNDVGMSENMLMHSIVQAFPIVVFKMQLSEDKSRKCMKIFEATGYNKIQNKVEGQILFSYLKSGIDLKTQKVIGEHKKVNNISLKLCQKMYIKGCPLEQILKYNPNFKIDDENDYIEDFIDINTRG